MRFVLFSAASVLAASLTGIAPAHAKWSCQGAEYVCGGASQARSDRPAYRQKARVSKSSNYRRAAKAERGQARSGRRYAKVSRGGRRSRVAATRVVRGSQTGMASYYWQGQRVASGGRFNPNAMTAAHKSLPFGTRVRVTNLNNGRSVSVTINDRGPFIKGRIIDLSRAAAGVVGMRSSGVARVRVDVVGRG